MAESSQIFDVIVIGGGAIGLSAAYWATKMQKSCLLLEQAGELFNKDGSSPGKTRMWRVMHSQLKLALLAQKTVDLWKDLQEQAKRCHFNESQLILPADMLWLGDPNLSLEGPEGDFTKAKEVSLKAGFPLEEIPWAKLPSYGFENVPKTYVGYSGLEANDLLAGVINVPLLCTVLQDAAVSAGLTIKLDTQVTAIKTDLDLVRVTDAKGNIYLAKKVIIAAGCWTNDVLKLFGVRLKYKIWEMTSFYWKSKVENGRFPMWISFAKEPTTADPNDLGFRYGFPEDPKGYVRICSTNPVVECDDMSQVKHEKDMKERDMLKQWLQLHMPSIDTEPDAWTVANISTCLTNYTPDGNYVLDFVPNTDEKVVVFTAGWAMKFVPMFGKVLAELAINGKVSTDLEPLIADFKIPANNTDRGGLLVEPIYPKAATAHAKMILQHDTAPAELDRRSVFKMLA